ncbi:hypothetical protein IWW38_003453 [Coemansia aciculifera]|uniref:Uncharacterized protein n=1 Tax=Coemansia aciculifera TaxID=417176 RepID=A0ACC1M1L2_9FUNG|nr:hypothetical protein IWW38_003453 [Coemansia aciculifera]
MALHINDFPTSPYNVLELILYMAASPPANTLAEWKSKLPLVAVCRAWTMLAQPFVFNHVFVEVLKMCTNREPYTRLPANETCIGWTSNAELFIPRHCVLMATRLSLAQPQYITPDHLKHIALDILKLDRVGWMHINSLAVVEASRVCKHYAVLLDSNDSARNKVEHALQFFAQNLRNIVKLKFTIGHFEPIGALICEELACMYGGQLQILRAQDYAPLPLLELSRNIAVLELTLDDKASWKLPDVCGEMLRELKLSNVPQNFAWRRFRYDSFVRPIVLPRLTILHIFYDGQDAELTDDKIQSRVSSGAHNCDQLCFPVLKELVIYNCTPDCDLLYADTPFPELERVTLVGSFDNIRHCSRLKLTWVRDLKVHIMSPRVDVTTGIHNATNPLFTSICIGRSAALDFGMARFVIDSEAIRWTNLTAISLFTVDYQTILKLIV